MASSEPDAVGGPPPIKPLPDTVMVEAVAHHEEGPLGIVVGGDYGAPADPLAVSEMGGTYPKPPPPSEPPAIKPLPDTVMASETRSGDGPYETRSD